LRGAGHYNAPLDERQRTAGATKTMSTDVDPAFYERADAHIHLSNEQNKTIERGKVSASMLYASARYNSWISACGFSSGEEMMSTRAETIEYFVAQYRLMLEENLDDYIQNFAKYMQPEG
jgi:hypothetical protein